jgi:tyrosyl-tRNA synthetase
MDTVKTKIDELLTRGVANVIPNKQELEKVLKSGKKLNIYLGIDPTATHIHLGHAVMLRKLQAFAELGHNVTFLIGDFTALIGDTSDKDTERPVLTSEQIEENFKTYKKQAEKVLDFSKVTVRHNSEWLSKLNFSDVVKLTRHFTLNDFISRELIKKRVTEGKSVSLPEVLYPVMQGYDSYFLDTDVQLGGTDQTFNMQAGRTLQKNLRQKESFVLTGEFLEGTDGRKMSKSWGNAIWLDDSANDVYGKVMSIKDELIEQYFILATSVAVPDLSNPMQAKKNLAWQIVKELFSDSDADMAQKHFESTVQNKELPAEIESVSISSNNIVDALVETKLTASKSEARRLIEQKGVKVNGETITSLDSPLPSGATISIGNRKFVKIK